MTKHRAQKYGSPPVFQRLLQEDTFSKKYLDYRNASNYHVTSSEDDDTDGSSDVEILETEISPVVTVNESDTQDRTLDAQLVDTPPKYTVALDPRGDRKTLRKQLRRKSQEHRLANFNSHRKKTPKSSSDEPTAEHQISALKTPAQSRDIDASFFLHRQLPPIERPSEMFYARPMEPPPPVSPTTSPQKCSIQ